MLSCYCPTTFHVKECAHRSGLRRETDNRDAALAFVMKQKKSAREAVPTFFAERRLTMGSRDDVLTDAEDADAGYIRAVRLRPLDERRGGYDGLLCVDREEALIKHKDHSYGPYTKVFDDAECNARLFDEVGQELVTSAQRASMARSLLWPNRKRKTYTMGEIQNIGRSMRLVASDRACTLRCCDGRCREHV